jgi:AAA family ATP:ADP antiporter
VAENSLDYSLENTSRQSLWLPTTSAEKYSAKQVIDTFLVRLGDVASAGIVLAGGALHFATRHFALLNVGLVLAWFGVLVPLVAEYKKRVVVAAARRAAQQAAEEAAAATAASAAEPA